MLIFDSAVRFIDRIFRQHGRRRHHRYRSSSEGSRTMTGKLQYSASANPFAAHLQHAASSYTGGLSHLHPRITVEFKEFHDKYGGRFSLGQLMEVGSLTWDMLPRLDSNVNPETGRCETCWLNILGICRMGVRCTFAHNHCEGNSLPDRYVSDVIKTFLPAAKKMVKDNIPIWRSRPVHSNDSKRPRRA